MTDRTKLPRRAPGYVMTGDDIEQVHATLGDVEQEVYHASIKFEPFNSPHEGYAVIKEELDELWDDVRKKNRGRSTAARSEAIQVAAMAVRYVVDLCNE